MVIRKIGERGGRRVRRKEESKNDETGRITRGRRKRREVEESETKKSDGERRKNRREKQVMEQGGRALGER